MEPLPRRQHELTEPLSRRQQETSDWDRVKLGLQSLANLLLPRCGRENKSKGRSRRAESGDIHDREASLFERRVRFEDAPDAGSRSKCRESPAAASRSSRMSASRTPDRTMPHSSTSPSERGRKQPTSGPPKLNILTLNLKCFSKSSLSLHQDVDEFLENLRKTTHGADVVAVQEGVNTRDALSDLGFKKVVCSAKQCLAEAVRDMFYQDPEVLDGFKEELWDELLCNQIYVSTSTTWEVAESGGIRISSSIMLDGRGGRCSGRLGCRSMVWIKLRSRMSDPIYVMCTHFSGGRAEDEYFAKELVHERQHQANKCMSWFDERRPDPRPGDSAILVGDFNAPADCDYESNGSLKDYFAGFGGCAGLKADVLQAGIQSKPEMMERFREYLLQPFEALEAAGWQLACEKARIFSNMAACGIALLPDGVEIKDTTGRTVPEGADPEHIAMLAAFSAGSGGLPKR